MRNVYYRMRTVARYDMYSNKSDKLGKHQCRCKVNRIVYNITDKIHVQEKIKYYMALSVVTTNTFKRKPTIDCTETNLRVYSNMIYSSRIHNNYHNRLY